MSMTTNEALERAGRIWDDAVKELNEGYGGCWEVVTKGGIYHQLDGNGHTDCHADCATLEQLAYPAPAVQDAPAGQTAEPTPAAPIVEPAPIPAATRWAERLAREAGESSGQTPAAGMYAELCERLGQARVDSALATLAEQYPVAVRAVTPAGNPFTIGSYPTAEAADTAKREWSARFPNDTLAIIDRRK